MDLLLLYLLLSVSLVIGIVIWAKVRQLENLEELITDMENLQRISQEFKWGKKMSKEDRVFLEEFVKK